MRAGEGLVWGHVRIHWLLVLLVLLVLCRRLAVKISQHRVEELT
jgi:hypothetical protein